MLTSKVLLVPHRRCHRYALGFKSIRYETVLIEHTEIEAVCKKIGAPPTGTKPDGSVTYTVLFMYDPSTKTAVADSVKIAEYRRDIP